MICTFFLFYPGNQGKLGIIHCFFRVEVIVTGMTSALMAWYVRQRGKRLSDQKFAKERGWKIKDKKFFPNVIQLLQLYKVACSGGDVGCGRWLLWAKVWSTNPSIVVFWLLRCRAQYNTPPHSTRLNASILIKISAITLTESWRTNKASFQLKYWPRRPPDIVISFEVILISSKSILGVHRNTRVHTVRVIVQRTRNVRGMVIMSVGRPA